MRISDVAALYEAPGPILSVYIDLGPEVLEAPERAALEWRDLRRRLEKSADRSILDAVDAEMPTAGGPSGTLAVIAHRGAVLLSTVLPERSPRSLAFYESLPYGAPLLAHAQVARPYVIAVVDRAGARIHAAVPDRRAEEVEVHGDDTLVARVSVGGWSQSRYERRVEQRWAENADMVAGRLVAVCEEVEPVVVLVAGDVRAARLVEERLPRSVRRLVETRQWEHPGGSDGIDPLVTDAEALTASRAGEETAAVLERFAEETGRRDRGTNGPAATVDALSRANVETLIVRADPDDARTTWFGPAPTQLALDLDAMAAMGVAAPIGGRLVDVLIRAAFRTGADVRIVPESAGDFPRDGVGALLRHRG